jgi:TorA maturation chaperone TorD
MLQCNETAPFLDLRAKILHSSPVGTELYQVGTDAAVAAVGGIDAFQARIGVSRRTVFVWKQQGIPAERAPEIEALTGIPRHILRPDLWPSPPPQDVPETDLVNENRAGAFALLGALLAAEPDRALLRLVAGLPGNDSTIGTAIAELAAAAALATPKAVEREYFDLFVGVGRGEILPYASYYLTGFLHERPLAELRATLTALGVRRQHGVPEPEDHIAFVAETMAGLLRGEIAAIPGMDPDEFYARHIRPWAGRLFADLLASQRADFYRAVGGFGRALLDIENAAAALPQGAS